MAGNVWEWTSDYFTTRPAGHAQHACCTPRNPRVTSAETSLARGEPGAHIPRRVTKAAPTCAPRTAACVTAPRPASPRRSTPPPATWACAASSESRRSETGRDRGQKQPLTERHPMSFAVVMSPSLRGPRARSDRGGHRPICKATYGATPAGWRINRDSTPRRAAWLVKKQADR